MSTSLTPLTFTGVSDFSDDFQTILTRAVSIANLPVKSLQNQQSDILQKKQLTTDLSTAVSDLASSIAALGTLGSSGGLTASSSDTSKVSVISSSVSSAATYHITQIDSVAKAAGEASLSGYATSDSTAVSSNSNGTVQLLVGNQKYTLSLGSKNNLAGLRDAINALDVGVTATILTTGTGATPYYLSVTANNTGATTLRLVDDPTGTAKDLLTSQNQGADASFLLNGARVQQHSNLINTVVPGLSFAILDTTDSNETITLSTVTDRNKISSALQDLVTQYNATAAKVNAQIGPNAGLLSGDSLIRDVQNNLRQLVQYHGSGSIQSLADLGIELSNTGAMSFNSDTFHALPDSSIPAALSFFGSATTGVGALAKNFTQISDPATGLIKIQQDQYDVADKRISDQIDALTERINSMQTTLSAKLQAADSLLAQLKSQQSILTSSIDALNYTVYGKQTSRNG